MFYDFPTIRKLEDILPIISDDPAIKIMKRGDGYEEVTIVDYVFANKETFPDAFEAETKMVGGIPRIRKTSNHNEAIIRRECRGLIFDRFGYLIRRPYHKFFNVGERWETFPEQIEQAFRDAHKYGGPSPGGGGGPIEKLDGSMIAPYYLEAWDPESCRFGTRMGDTDIAKDAGYFARESHIDYFGFINLVCNRLFMTPIFEWCSLSNKVVIEHVEPKLVLTAIRHMTNGTYMDLDTMMKFASEWGVPVVNCAGRPFGIVAHSLESHLSYVKAQTDTEGAVYRWGSGHMVKMKSDWYCARHRAMDGVLAEKDVVRLICNGAIDDVKPMLTDTILKQVEEFETQFHRNLTETMEAFMVDYEYAREQTKRCRKTFAVRHSQDIDSVLRGIAFGLWDLKTFTAQDLQARFFDVILRKTGTTANLETVRHLYGYATYTYNPYRDRVGQ